MVKTIHRVYRLLLSVVPVVFMVVTATVRAQAISDEIPITWQSRIKMIDQFMSRFNGTDSPKGADKSDPQYRIKLMASAFDFDYLNANPDLCMNFITDMISGGYKLDFEDNDWYAITQCDAVCRGQNTKLTIVFRTEKDSRGLYKWVIYRAQGEALEMNPPKVSPSYKISPADNEVDFIHLSEITSQDRDLILNYSSKDFDIDQTTVFFTLVATEQLRIKQVNEISYQFEKGNYLFTVNRYNRENTNSGWLISQVHKK